MNLLNMLDKSSEWIIKKLTWVFSLALSVAVMGYIIQILFNQFGPQVFGFKEINWMQSMYFWVCVRMFKFDYAELGKQINAKNNE